MHICFVCTGNICRSPMAEVIARAAITDAGLDGVRLTSCGLGGWHVGDQADYRARAELAANGYNGEDHRAAQLGEEHADADLFIALDTGHVDGLVRAGIDRDRIRLMRSFDPSAPAGASVADPYYGDAAGFAVTRRDIEGAMDGLLAWIRENSD